MVPLRCDSNGELEEVAEKWAKPPLEISMQFYPFNVTNSDAILGGAKPSVRQHGPYGYR